MFRISDIFILLAVAMSFVVSAYLWFTGDHTAGIFTAIWVPSILTLAIYFKFCSFVTLYNSGKKS